MSIQLTFFRSRFCFLLWKFAFRRINALSKPDPMCLFCKKSLLNTFSKKIKWKDLRRSSLLVFVRENSADAINYFLKKWHISKKFHVLEKGSLWAFNFVIKSKKIWVWNRWVFEIWNFFVIDGFGLLYFPLYVLYISKFV